MAQWCKGGLLMPSGWGPLGPAAWGRFNSDPPMTLNREALRHAYKGGVRSLILAMKEAGYRRGKYRKSSALEVITFPEGGDTLCVGADVSGRPEWRKLPAVDMK